MEMERPSRGVMPHVPDAAPGCAPRLAAHFLTVSQQPSQPGFRMKAVIALFLATALVVVYYGMTSDPPEPTEDTGPGADSALARVAGCWRFEGSHTQQFPEGFLAVLLDTALSPRLSPRQPLVILDSARNRTLRLRWWAATHGKYDFRLRLSTGYAGLDIRVDLRDAVLVGRSYPITDFRNIFKHRPSRIRGRPISCPDHIPEAAG
jgi:hypothetical protein